MPFDIGYHSKQSPEHVLSMLTPILEMCLDGTGYFVSGLHANGAVCHLRQTMVSVIALLHADWAASRPQHTSHIPSA